MCSPKGSTVYLIIFMSFSIAASQKVQQTGPCSCETSDGTIDLEGLGHQDGTPSFSDSVSSFKSSVHVNVYFFNPCFPFSIGPQDSACSNVALCLKSNKTEYTDIGKQKGVKFLYDYGRNLVYMKYSSQDTNITSLVYLVCADTNFFRTEGTVDSKTYRFAFASPCACPDGCVNNNKLGVGSVLCIVFVSLVLTYFVVGILYNKAVYGATGIELVPNHRFWISLPGLIKDGYLFFISPCLGDRIEYKTYQQL